MPRVFSFPPIADVRARTLILGSIPGEASLSAGEYYAHPRNHFWRIMSVITGAPCDAPYEERKRALVRNKTALWDVLRSCRRAGSLDSAIDEPTEEANDFVAFFEGHRNVARVFFNGGKAEKSFEKHVRPLLGQRGRKIVCVRLPSTSPANASWPFDRKKKAWSNAFLHGNLMPEGHRPPKNIGKKDD